MQTTRSYLIVILLLCFLQPAVSQQRDCNLKGFVLSIDYQPVIYSTVLLMDMDTVFIKGVLSQEDGMFHIEKIEPGEYLLMIRNVEFETWISDPVKVEPGATREISNILLKTKLNNLEEVVVTTKKAPVEVHPDKIVFNVNSSINTSGNNGLELLSIAPGVIIDPDKNIMLLGKSGVHVYINGHPSRLSGSDLAIMLEGLRSENIESIEIITNPSVKYEAEGSAGIINIILKKNPEKGFNGNLTGSYSKGKYPKANIGGSMNLRNEKINIFSSLNFSDNEYMEDLTKNTFQDNFLISLESLLLEKRRSVNFSGGMDYTINKNHTFSLDTRIQLNEGDNSNNSRTEISDINEELPSQILNAQTIDDLESENYNLNLHYGYLTGKSSSLTTDVSYGRYSKGTSTWQPNEYYTGDGEYLLRTIYDQYDNFSDIDIFSACADYEQKIDRYKLMGGSKYSIVNTVNQIEYFFMNTGEPLFDPDRSNDFNYRERIFAAYLMLNTALGERVSLNAGLRVENTYSRGELTGNVATDDDLVTRNYMSIFPSFSASYNDQEQHAVSLSIGRRITRPNYMYLNPFEIKYSEIFAYKGNPFLRPNYIMNYQVSYSFKRMIVLSNNFSVTRDYFARIFVAVDSVAGILTPRNMDKVINNGLSLSLPMKVTNWWGFHTMLIYSYSDYMGDMEETLIDLDIHNFYIRMQNNFKLPWGILLEVTGMAQSPFIWLGSVRIEGRQTLDIGLKKDFIKGRVLVQLTGKDILGTGSDYYYSSDYGGMITDGIRTFDDRRYGVSLKYNFGNQQASSAKRKSSAMQEELNRIEE